MGLKWDDKDPNDVLDYSIDWSDYLAVGETVASVVHSISAVSGDASPLAIDTTKPDSGESVTASGSLVWLKNGTAGNIHYITAKITTSANRVWDRKVKLKIKDL